MDIWGKEWISVLKSSLKGFLDSQGILSKPGLTALADNVIELNSSLQLLVDLSKNYHIDIDYVFSVNEIYELCLECSNKNSALQPLFRTVSKNLRKFLEYRGYIRPAELSDYDKLRQYELERLDRIINAVSLEIHEDINGKKFSYLNRAEILDKDRVLDYVADILIGYYCKKQVKAKK